VLELNYKSQFLRVRSSQACQQVAIARKESTCRSQRRRAQRHGSGAAPWMLENANANSRARADRGTTDAVTGPAARVAALHGGQPGVSLRCRPPAAGGGQKAWGREKKHV